mmetsp:Transcript_23968/g.66412  ORF Transcript_23968/g.66412 Transcript_23968/m.66412 type:complete len:223 (+) Transcript_23968:450-1118(+)
MLLCRGSFLSLSSKTTMCVGSHGAAFDSRRSPQRGLGCWLGGGSRLGCRYGCCFRGQCRWFRFRTGTGTGTGTVTESRRRRIGKHAVVVGFHPGRPLPLQLLDRPLGRPGPRPPLVVLPQVEPVGRERIGLVAGILLSGRCKDLRLGNPGRRPEFFLPKPDRFGVVRMGIKVAHELEDVVCCKGSDALESEQSLLDVLAGAGAAFLSWVWRWNVPLKVPGKV